jgi:tetratricopeptide (TPR) repeat protein
MGALLLALSAACAPARTMAPPVAAPVPAVPTPTAEGQVSPFDEALRAFLEHERRGTWTREGCVEVAEKFEHASEGSRRAGTGEIPQALYDAGVALARCDLRAEARKRFERAAALDSGLFRARTQVAVHRAQGDGKDLDEAIQALEKVVLDAAFQSPDALVELARLEMRRRSDRGGAGCTGDLECAKKNIQRALAVDDGYLPAYDLLALYYLENARATKGKKENRQQLELAILVTSQAIKRRPDYAPIHNTAGLVQAELGDMSGASQAFQRAFEIDHRFLEALVNFGAINLGFRGFNRAEMAFRRALELRPDDYDVLLGLSLALRGQLRDADPDADRRMQEARALLERARTVAPDRPESYYNEGILTEEFEARSAIDDRKKLASYRRALDLYALFQKKAGQRPDLERSVGRAAERMADIHAVMRFLEEGASPTPP